MMVVVLFRILIIISLILIAYTCFQYFRNPGRRLNLAKTTNEFFFLDEPNSSMKNIQFVYKGCSFEGEKYLGATEEAFEVVDIHIVVHNPMELQGLTREDLYFLEQEILIRYPYATVKWKHPISKLLLTDDH